MKTRAKAKPNSEIAEWWLAYARRLYASGKEEKIPKFIKESIFYDWGEAVCWGCGRFFGDAAEMKCDNTLDAWNTSRLYRCHVIPHSLGGSSKPNNIVLLCAECHLEAPDSSNPRHMFLWLNGRRRAVREDALRQIGEACAALKISTEDFCRWRSRALARFEGEWDKFLVEKTSLHLGGSGAKLKWSSVVVATRDFAKLKGLDSNA